MDKYAGKGLQTRRLVVMLSLALMETIKDDSHGLVKRGREASWYAFPRKAWQRVCLI